MTDRIRAWLWRRWYGFSRMINGCARWWLRRNDHSYALAEAQRELIRRREAAIAAGISPGDPRYPDLWDIVPFPKLPRLKRGDHA